VPRDTLVGESVQANPVPEDTVATRPTVPVNPWRAVDVIVDVPLVPAKIVTPVGLTEIPKS